MYMYTCFLFSVIPVFNIYWLYVILYSSVTYIIVPAQLVIGTSRTVGSAKKFVRITSGFGGGEFTKTLRKVPCMYMSKIEIFFFTARILQNQRMLCCGECFHD
jgi:hypothetical protein